MRAKYVLDAVHADWKRGMVRRYVSALVGVPAVLDGIWTHHIYDVKEQLLYAIVRTLRPERVVETGVWVGWSSRAILSAMFDNRKGTLVSIDLPTIGQGHQNADGKWDPTHVSESSETGKEVPEYLRQRWKLVLGPSTELLPTSLSAGPIDMFFHDSDHASDLMKWEYETAWPTLRAGGILYSDDVDWNDAFASFARSVGRPPHTFRVNRDGNTTGGLRK